ncbi:MAG: methylated-DNA--[protein]-cysteine S-methyltransferase [Actinomycetes bacterium]|jgi:methylated-DNA-[protein]-cysteine S-methyltransferase|nr:methylated-DNA--[protein]-cysteine S-methyltransferase [Actinomycetes bacterium]
MGIGTELRYQSTYESPLGAMTLASDGQHLRGLWFVGQKHYPRDALTAAARCDDVPVFQHVVAWLDDYFAGRNPTTRGIALAASGTAFQRAVWDCLSAIPYGTTTTYGAIARAVGCGSPRAVGVAIGRNPLSIIVPCHRVIAADGSLTGYAGGLARKRSLLQREQTTGRSA